MNKAVFLDRDGTIIEDRGYLSRKEDVLFIEGVFDSLRKLQEEYLLFIVTNQSGVGKGLTCAEDVDAVNDFVVDTLRKNGIEIEELYSCPHCLEDDCDCRKPKTKFVELAREKYDLDLRRSAVIGDHPSDLKLAVNFGGRGLYVLSGHGEKHLNEIVDHALVFNSVNDAAAWLITDGKMA